MSKNTKIFAIVGAVLIVAAGVWKFAFVDKPVAQSAPRGIQVAQ